MVPSLGVNVCGQGIVHPFGPRGWDEFWNLGILDALCLDHRKISSRNGKPTPCEDRHIQYALTKLQQDIRKFQSSFSAASLEGTHPEGHPPSLSQPQEKTLSPP